MFSSNKNSRFLSTAILAFTVTVAPGKVGVSLTNESVLNTLTPKFIAFIVRPVCLLEFYCLLRC